MNLRNPMDYVVLYLPLKKYGIQKLIQQSC